MRIDHVIYVTADLDAAAARVQSGLGLTAVRGGRHQGHGTHNRIVPLGGGYLELMAVADADEAAASPMGSAVQARLAEQGEGLFAWAAVVDDVDQLAERLGLPLITVTREGLSARVAGLDEALRNPVLPFFLERGEGVADPGEGADAGGITWLEVSGDGRALESRIGGAEMPVRIVEGPVGVLAMGIGDREFRTP